MDGYDESGGEREHHGEDFERTFEDVSLPDAVTGFTATRVALVKRAAREWASALIDLGGRNNLLRYRDLRAGTLDLTKASPVAIETFLASSPVRISALFPDPEERLQQLRRVRTIHNKAKENFEERGIETLSLACGLATWENKRASGWTPCAPVLLRHATLRALGAAQDEFELELLDEMEVNPTLAHVLNVDFDCALPQEELLNRVDGVIDEIWELEETYAWLREHAARIPGFSIEPRLVVTNFAYAKLPMVRDIEGSFEQLVAHDLIAAVAGDEGARETIRGQGPPPDAVPSPDDVPLADEFLVLDADSSQNYAINAVLGGTSLIVRGPPGTGKSQTIANLLASLMARNKKVLFVAEKRAAIDAVLKRLHENKLDDFVLDLHGGAGSRRAFAERIGKALLAVRSSPRVDAQPVQKKVEKNRAALNAYVRSLHEPREPWGTSIFDMRAELISLGELAFDLRFGPKTLENLDAEAIDRAEESLREYARIGGLTLSTSDSPWRNAGITSGAEAQRALQLVEEARRQTLPQAVDALSAAAEEVGLPSPPTLTGWEPVLELWAHTRGVFETFRPEVFAADLAGLCAQLAPAAEGGFSRIKASVFSGEYKTARAQLQTLLAESVVLKDLDLLRCAEQAGGLADRWKKAGALGSPSVPTARNLEALYDELQTRLAQISTTVGEDLLALRADDASHRLAALAEDRATLLKLPELHRLRTEIHGVHLAEFLAPCEERALTEDSAVAELRGCWLHSILDQLVFADLTIGAFDADRHDATIEEYRAGDAEHIETTPARIRRICAENFLRVREANPAQDQLLLAQAKLKRNHKPVRDVVRRSEDVLLALKPCWAMSPLLVSQLLPAKTMFDVVIFDEASQITPADAIPSIVRGEQLVVAGDDRQLPPTAFFTSETPEVETDEDEPDEVAELADLGMAGTADFESILDALNQVLRWRMLRWHYRSRDERLIAFSNAHIYDRMLVTFPGVGGADVLRWEEVPRAPSGETNSPSGEVSRVVDLIFEHAHERPHESLGVIAMGIKHAERIEDCRLERLHQNPALAEELGDFFSDERPERFFVKNLERVQGDERDAIILSIGYGKNQNGLLPLRFGPLLVEGGERRLNVAVTRAKHRLTLVSSFGAGDIDLEKTNAAGVHLLRQYVQYVASEGTNLGDAILEKPELNPFEVDVRDTLARHGLRLTSQYGTSGYWIDFVAPHPAEPGRYVLAIECDGATYHSSESARDRDRLRQDQLERLGWNFCRIWSSEWFYNRERCVEKVLGAYRQAVEDAERPQTKHHDEVSMIGASAPSVNTDGEARNVADQVREAFGRSRGSNGEGRAGPRPHLASGKPIEKHALVSLVRLARWIDSGDAIFSEDEMLREMMTELGYRRMGNKIESKLRQAIRQARR